MLDALTIADAGGSDVSLMSATRLLKSISGLQGVATPREIVRDRPSQHGQIIETAYFGEKTVAIEGALVGVDEAAIWTEFDALNAALWDAIDTPRTLKWTRSAAGLQLQSAVQLAGLYDAPIRADDAGVILPYQVILRREDPRAYSQTQTTTTGAAITTAGGGLTFPAEFPWLFTPSGAGESSPNNGGNVPTPAIFRIYGYVTAPQIIDTGSTRKMTLSGEIGVGDYLEIDVRERTAKLNGLIDRENLVDFANTDWLTGEFEGAKTFRLIASTFDGSARLDVLHRNAYA